MQLQLVFLVGGNLRLIGIAYVTRRLFFYLETTRKNKQTKNNKHIVILRHLKILRHKTSTNFFVFFPPRNYQFQYLYGYQNDLIYNPKKSHNDTNKRKNNWSDLCSFKALNAPKPRSHVLSRPARL